MTHKNEENITTLNHGCRVGVLEGLEIWMRPHSLAPNTLVRAQLAVFQNGGTKLFLADRRIRLIIPQFIGRHFISAQAHCCANLTLFSVKLGFHRAQGSCPFLRARGHIVHFNLLMFQ